MVSPHGASVSRRGGPATNFLARHCTTVLDSSGSCPTCKSFHRPATCYSARRARSLISGTTRWSERYKAARFLTNCKIRSRRRRRRQGVAHEQRALASASDSEQNRLQLYYLGDAVIFERLDFIRNHGGPEVEIQFHLLATADEARQFRT